MKKFEQDLEALRQRILEMGNLAQSMVAMSLSAMTDLPAVYKNVLAVEDQVDQMQLAIDREVVRLFSVYTPVAADLRFVLSASRINNALERIGDQAVGLCHNLDFSARHADAAELPKLRRMGDTVQTMVLDALLAFANKDADLARKVMEQDDLVDQLNDEILKDILNGDARRPPGTAPIDVAEALTQILLGRSLERMGDQATNICEEIIYMVQGDDIRHCHPPHPSSEPPPVE
jgi:phosphate transport system protein